MLRKSVLVAAFICFIGGFTPPARAVLIVDTGSPPNLFPGPSLYGNSFPTTFQWMAGQVSLGASYVINQVQGWIYESSGTATLAVYGDDSGLPDPTNEFFSGGFGIPDGGGADWYGVSGMNLNLDPGTYWFAFEVRGPADTYNGHLPGLQFPGFNPIPNPLADYATYNNEIPVWHDAGQFIVFGLRVDANEATQTVIPEPSSLLLLSAGLLGLAKFRRKHF